MKGFAKLVGRLPFAGKILIRPLVFGLYQSMTAGERRRSYWRLMLLLLCLVLFHGVHAQLGVRALNFVAPVWARLGGAVYAIVNVGVVLTQVHLGLRATLFCLRGRYPGTKRSDTGYSDAEIVTMVTVTLGGQIVFLSLYLWYS